MSRLLIAVVIVLGMGRFAVAERIAVSCDRSANAVVVKRVLDAWIASEGIEGDKWIDVGVVRLDQESAQGQVYVVAEIRASLSEKGRIVSVLSGSSRVAVPAREYRPTHAEQLRREALVSAAQAMLPNLRAHFRPATRVATR